MNRWRMPLQRGEAIRESELRARRAANVLDAYRLLSAYANPLRSGMPLSSTETDAVRRAARLLRASS